MRLLLALACSVEVAVACTAYAAGKLATVEGVLVSHSDDGSFGSDPRVSYVPAADHWEGAQRPIWPDLEDYPRFVGTERGKTYTPLEHQQPTEPIGSIPQVAHTHGYYEQNYAMQNECGLSFGESTASAVFRADAVGTAGGKALLCINELTRIAAERTCSAREAVKLMGELAERHGFYGPDGGAGEVLTVGDGEEAFVFHILSDPSAASALWVAQRVPDDHIAVVANMFTIREVDLKDRYTFLGSDNLLSTARSHGLWDGKAPFDFTRAYSLGLYGEYASKYYSGRRMWDGYRRFAPSLHLPAEYGNLKADAPHMRWGRSVYPFSAKPDAPLTLSDIFAAHRSHYEGTPYSTTTGLAAGPFGTPERYAVAGLAGDPGTGAWERTVSIYRTDMTWAATAAARPDGATTGTIWAAPGDSSKSVFMPLIVAAGEPPLAYTLGTSAYLDRKSAYWAHRYLANVAQIRYSAMIGPIVEHQRYWEGRAAALVARLRGGTGEGGGGGESVEDGSNDVKEALDGHAAALLAATWQLVDDLVVRFADGGETSPKPDGSVEAHDLGYSREWLRAADLEAGPKRLGAPAVEPNAEAPNAEGAAVVAAAMPWLPSAWPLADRRSADFSSAVSEGPAAVPLVAAFVAGVVFAGAVVAGVVLRRRLPAALARPLLAGSQAAEGQPNADWPEAESIYRAI